MEGEGSNGEMAETEATRMERIMVASVGVVTNTLSDEELAALNLCVQLDMDPHGRIFDYDAVQSLFTEDGRTRTHDATKEALARIVNRRLAPKGT